MVRLRSGRSLGVCGRVLQRDARPHGPGNTSTKPSVKVADQVWVVVALLHREHPERVDFTVEEIVGRARREPISQPLRPSFPVHVTQHCVANRAPNPGRWRMLFESAPGRRRLFRPDDTHHSVRANARSIPDAAGLPSEYQDLLSWYRREYARRPSLEPELDPLLVLQGSGRALWADESADAYVQRLREGWA